MPPNAHHQARRQQQRQSLASTKRSEQFKMVVSIQVLSVDSVEMATSLMVATESTRLMFNVGDGTQRMCMEHHVRLGKLANVFLTELRPHTVGGLPGMVLTVSDTGKHGLTVHGPVGTTQYMRATRHFLVRPQFDLQAKDLGAAASPAPSKKAVAATCPASACYADDAVFVVPAVIKRARTGAKRRVDGSVASPAPAEPSTAVANGSPTAVSDTSSFVTDCVSYVVETPCQRGKFLVDKAVALGVPKGKLFGQLHQGKDVTLPDGRVVKSSDCVSPPLPGSGAAIISCPSVAYLDSLVENAVFGRYQSRTSGGDTRIVPPHVQLHVVYHLASEQVLQHPKYVEWVSKFGADVDHVLLNHNGCAQKTVYRSSAKLQTQLNALFPRVFPPNDLESRDGEQPFTRTIGAGQQLPFVQQRPAVLGESMLKYTISPANRRGFDASTCFRRLNPDEIRASVAAFQARLADAKAQDESSEAEAQDAGHVSGRITFLGTGCAIPSKYRNVTGMYIEVDVPRAEATTSWNGMMLDCGEGSFGQLYRYANGDRSRLQELVDRLQCVWISHNHADHHLGLLRMISERSSSVEAPLLIIAPAQVEHWLKEYSAIDPTVATKYKFVDNAHFNEQDANFQHSYATVKPTRALLKSVLNITHLETVPVKHAYLSYALVATFGSHTKIAFSGDCRPSDRFAEKAKDALLLIHEATFEEGMTQEAKQKDHSTTGEAIDIGRKAAAKHIILTHFSQRYPKMPVVDTKEDVMTAFDLMSLDFQALQQPKLMEICMELMSADDDDTDTPET